MFDSTQLFCVIDDFFLKFESIYWKFLKHNFQRRRYRPAQLSISEIIFIAIWYKCSHFNNFKAFFTSLKLDKNHLFKQRPRYQRMIYLINAHQLALHALHLDLIAKYWIKRPPVPVRTIPVTPIRIPVKKLMG
jgi:hypothetical protein